VSRRSADQVRARARRRIDALVSEAWSEHVRESVAQDRRAQQARQDEANLQQLLRILARMRRRGSNTR
jgi:hypothetical protein